VAEKLLHGADVVASLQKMRGEGMAEGMRGHPLADAGIDRSGGHGSLNYGFMEMMAAFLPFFVAPTARGGEDPLPTPVPRSIGKLSRDGVGQPDSVPSRGQVFLMNESRVDDLFVPFVGDGSRQDGRPVVLSLRIANDPLASLGIDVFPPQHEAFPDA
jgi:hypothetical protein